MIFRFGTCLLDSRLRELAVDGTRVHVEPQVFDVLRYLIENRDRVVSRDELIEAVWHGRIVSDTTISARIFAARHAVGDTGDAQAVIRTLPRCGFRFVAQVEDDPDQEERPRSRKEPPIPIRAGVFRNVGFAKILWGSTRRFSGLVVSPILLLFALTGVWWTELNLTARDRDDFVANGARTIAVMPFDSFSNQEEQRFLGQGVADDILTELSRNTEVTVVARSAAFALGEKGKSAREVARELDVQYILDGTVRRDGEELRISAQLINGETGNHVWAERYHATAGALYDTQDEIVGRIVGTLLSEVRETEKAAILRRPPKNLDVYELTLRGLARKHRLNAVDLRLGREDLLRAIEIDPHYAPAWLYLGWVESLAYAYQWDGEVTLEEAIRKIERAIELDPTLASAYQALGIAMSFAGRTQEALQAARRSVELGPGDADNILALGRALATVGEFDEAIRLTRQAMALNPSRPSFYAYNLGRALWGGGELDEASSLMDECLTKTPGFTACRVFQIATKATIGKAADASNAVAILRDQSPSFSVDDAIKSVGFAGNPELEEQLSRQLVEAGLPSGRDADALRVDQR